MSTVEKNDAQMETVDGVEERWIQLAFTWSGTPYTLDIAE
jgi:hypothetical protein